MLLPRNPAAARASVPFLWHLDSFPKRHTDLQVKLCWCPPDHDSLWFSEVRCLTHWASHGGTRSSIPHTPSEAHFRQSTTEIAFTQWLTHWKSLKSTQHFPVTQAVLPPQATPYPLWQIAHPKRSTHGSLHHQGRGITSPPQEGETRSEDDHPLSSHPPLRSHHHKQI